MVIRRFSMLSKIQKLLISLIFLKFCTPDCSTENFESCPSCCAILYSSEKCEIGEIHSKFYVKENGNGVLGAIWDDVPKSLLVRNGCLLEVWDWKNQTGPKRAFGLEGFEVFPLERYAFESRISSLTCKCVKLPPTTTEAPDDETEEILSKIDERDEDEESIPAIEEINNSTIEI